jgi:cyclic pyranopterin phosphate synthase
VALEDAHGRLLGDLRVSVTDRCNFRCRYCMPAEGMPWIDREQILSFEEIERLVRMLVGLGMEDVRLTGGEPLVRRDLPRLVKSLASIQGIRDLSLTTNGYLLADQAGELVEAGIDRVNVSIDSLARGRFFEITRRDALDRVLAGLEAIAAFPEVRPIKVNAVPMPGFGREDVLRFCELARRPGFQVRFIEFMPLDGERAWRPEDVLSPTRPPASSSSPTATARSASSILCRSRSAQTATGFA